MTTKYINAVGEIKEADLSEQQVVELKKRGYEIV